MSRVQHIRIVAQDPSVKASRDPDSEILTTIVAIPTEELDEGPRGYRVTVIDYDASRRVYYEPWRADPGEPLSMKEAHSGIQDDNILDDPTFHARNVYAIVMRTLTRFELALGRRVPWGFDGQTLKIAPHAFQDANAYYSREDQALLFGYFPSRSGEGWVYTCLSHDIVVHETTHAILDGLRERYTDLSHPDQMAFHEGFADVIAILSVFSLRDVVRAMLLQMEGVSRNQRLIPRERLTVEELARSTLLGLAEQMGEEVSAIRGRPLRNSARLVAREVDPDLDELREPHRRGEILVAAMLNTFIAAWLDRLKNVGDGKEPVSVAQAVEEAAEIADTLLNIAIKALDYAPPVDVRFSDYLSALLTSDREVRPDDTKYRLRNQLRGWFARYGIRPAGKEDDGTWTRSRAESFIYDGSHIESIQQSPEEVYRFLWQNRRELRLNEDAYTRVLSVRPSLRVASDGFLVRETVAEYKQNLSARAIEVARHIELPGDLLASEKSMEIKLSGGGLLIFDEYGRLKYHVYQRLFGERQVERIQVLWELGLLGRPEYAGPALFASLHAARAEDLLVKEGW